MARVLQKVGADGEAEWANDQIIPGDARIRHWFMKPVFQAIGRLGV
jgi:hypothetical protein